MKIKSLKSCIEEFYTTNEESLIHSYPGLNQNILFKFFSDDLKLNLNSNISKLDFEQYSSQLLKSIPLAYIASVCFFYDLELDIGKDVLIPRFETEILIDESINLINQNSYKSVLDVGAGSGAIILNILKACELEYAMATDISYDVLKICEKNFEKHKENLKTKKLDLVISDKLTHVNHLFDIIVSNPPYIKESSDKAGVHFQADRYEPHLALYIKDNEYDAWFDDLFRQTFNNLNNGGYFIMEGHEDHIEAQLKVALNYFHHGEVLKDLTGAKRFLKLKKD